MAKRRSEDSSKPPRSENDLQPLAEETDAVVRDIVGETHVEPVPLDEPGIRLYRVREGDTLGSIAQRFYGDSNQYRRILDVNRDLLGENDEPIIGTDLRIPESD